MLAIRPRAPQGFTLVELMIIVVIIGVLASTAIPAFTRYRHRARSAEAPSVIGAIALRQESYRFEYGQYLTEPGGTNGASDFYPDGTLGEPAEWDDTAAGNPFGLLGASPNSTVYYQYRVSAGFGSAPATQYSGSGWSDWWYVIEAQSDLDGNGNIGRAEGIAGRAEIWRNGEL